MGKRILALLLFIIMATSGVVLWQRHTVERNNKTIAFLMHGPDIAQHSKALDIDVATYLESLQRAGLYGLVIPYEHKYLKEIAQASGLAVIASFHNESIDSVLEGLQGDAGKGEIEGITFLSADSQADPAVLSLLPDITLYIIQRNDTFRGYLPSQINKVIVSEGLPAVRTYRISYWEMDNPHVTPDNMVPRWLGNIREYNTRAIYARPFFDEGAEKNVYYVEQVAKALQDAGYRIGAAKPFADYHLAPWVAAVAFLGAGAVVLGLAYVLSLPVMLLKLSSVGLLLGAALMFTPYALPLRLGMGLISAVAASCLGSIWVLRRKARKSVTLWWQTFATVNLITLMSALLTVSLLSDSSFIMEYQFFRGVKVQYVLPLIIVAAYAIYKAVGLLEIERLVTRSWKVTILVLIIAISGLAVYIVRSGNVERVPQIEVWLRAWFDTTLVARPRFKELATHPILLIALYYRKRLSNWIYAVAIIAATVGQVSIVNTFLHLRTPLAISMLRVFHGLWIGTALGLLGIGLISVASRYLSRVGGQTK